MKLLTLLLLLAAPLTLASCAAFNAALHPPATANSAAAQNMADASCPPIVLVPAFRAIHQFKNDQAPRQANAISAAVITGVSAACSHTGSNIAIDMDIAFRSVLGPMARDWQKTRTSFAYPYFIAITRPDGTVLSQEAYGVTVQFAPGQGMTTQHEHLHHIIPLAMSSGAQLIIGFRLTEAQLAYNRSLAGLQNLAAIPVPPIAIESTTPVTAQPAAKPKAKPAKKKPHQAAAS